MFRPNNLPQIENEDSFWVRFGWIILAVLIVIFLIFYFFETAQAEESGLADIIQQVITNNPTLFSAGRSAEAAQKRITQTSALNDPRIAYKGGSNSAIDLIQPFKNPGMQWTEIESAKQEALIASLNYLAVERELIMQVKQIYYQVYELDQGLRIAARERSIMEAMYQSALRRYETGQVTQQDPLRGSLALVELQTKVSELIQKRNSLLAQLKQLSGGQVIAVPTINKVVLPESNIELDKLRPGLKNNPEVLMTESEYQKALLEKEGSKVINQPEFELGAEYTPAMGETMAMAGVTLPLWWNKNSARLDERTDLINAASNNYKTVVLAKNYELENIYLKIKRNEATLNLYKEKYLPQMQQAFTVAEASYLGGKLDFMDWLSVETRRLDAQLKYYELAAEQAMLFAELEKISGRENLYENN